MAVEFTMTRRVQFAEVDLVGVLHFANYLRIMEECEHAFWRSRGTSVLPRDGDRDIIWPRVSVTCEYFEAIRFEEEITLLLRVAEVGDRSVTHQIEFLRDGKRLAAGTMKTVCCARADGTFTSIDIPQPLRRALTTPAG